MIGKSSVKFFLPLFILITSNLVNAQCIGNWPNQICIPSYIPVLPPYNPWPDCPMCGGMNLQYGMYPQYGMSMGGMYGMYPQYGMSMSGMYGMHPQYGMSMSVW